MPVAVRSAKKRETITWMRAYRATCRYCRGEVLCLAAADGSTPNPETCSCQRCGQPYRVDVAHLPSWRHEQTLQLQALRALREYASGRA